jgi:hypothetical protein
LWGLRHYCVSYCGSRLFQLQDRSARPHRRMAAAESADTVERVQHQGSVALGARADTDTADRKVRVKELQPTRIALVYCTAVNRHGRAYARHATHSTAQHSTDLAPNLAADLRAVQSSGSPECQESQCTALKAEKRRQSAGELRHSEMSRARLRAKRIGPAQGRRAKNARSHLQRVRKRQHRKPGRTPQATGARAVHARARKPSRIPMANADFATALRTAHASVAQTQTFSSTADPTERAGTHPAAWASKNPNATMGLGPRTYGHSRSL